MKHRTKLNIISYNLHYHRADSELEKLIKAHKADVICLQECFVEQLPYEIGGLSLADTTNYGRMHMAIYYNPKRFGVLETKSLELERSVIEKVLTHERERLLITKFQDKKSKQPISIASFHAMYLLSTPALRRRQINAAHRTLRAMSGNDPAIIVGDYNYPNRKRLQACIAKTGYDLSLSDKPTYYLTKYLRGYFDLAASINTHIEKVVSLPKGLSDHTPILVQVTI